jgi:hypothetical protein
MKDITIASGEVVTQEKFNALNSGGSDTLTEFLATSADVRLLAQALVEQVVGMEWYLSYCSSLSDLAWYDYLVQRLVRVLDFMPEIEKEIQEELMVARQKLKIDLGDRSLPASPGCPKCFSPLDRQHAVLGRRHYAMRATAEGKWELGESQQAPEEDMVFYTFRCTDCWHHYTSFRPRNAHDAAIWIAELQEKEEGLRRG